MSETTGTPEKRGTQMLYSVAELVTEALRENQVEPDQARQVGLAAADLVRQHYGGEQIYVPKGLALIITERDREIYRKFLGGNHFALAKEYGLTVRQIYSIVARVKEEEFLARQGDLFG